MSLETQLLCCFAYLSFNFPRDVSKGRLTNGYDQSFLLSFNLNESLLYCLNLFNHNLVTFNFYFLSYFYLRLFIYDLSKIT